MAGRRVRICQIIVMMTIRMIRIRMFCFIVKCVDAMCLMLQAIGR